MLSLKIALRYLLARKSHNAVNVIAGIAVGGVCVAVAAMVVVLSIYNGFDTLARQRLSRLDPELMVQRADGGVIADADSLARVIAGADGVAGASPVVLERALAVTPTAQTPVLFMGVADDYSPQFARLDSLMIEGGLYATHTTAGQPAAQISVGVANQLVIPADVHPTLTLYTPRRVGRINPANPAASFRQADVAVSGVFRTDQNDLDADMIIIPLETARQLMDYDHQASSVSVALRDGVSATRAAQTLSQVLGSQYTVKDRLQQRSGEFQMIQIEKWVTFMMLVFVLVIALFNIVSTLSLLIIEKRGNMATLRAMGATRRQVRGIFAWQGIIITVAGGLLGTVLGVALSLAQEYGKFIKLGNGGDTTVIDSYPVRVDGTDLLAVMAAVVVMGLLMAAVTRLLTARLFKN